MKMDEHFCVNLLDRRFTTDRLKRIGKPTVVGIKRQKLIQVLLVQRLGGGNKSADIHHEFRFDGGLGRALRISRKYSR